MKTEYTLVRHDNFLCLCIEETRTGAPIVHRRLYTIENYWAEDDSPLFYNSDMEFLMYAKVDRKAPGVYEYVTSEGKVMHFKCRNKRAIVVDCKLLPMPRDIGHNQIASWQDSEWKVEDMK